MTINHIPTKVSGYVTTEITLKKSDGFKKVTSIMIVHNIPVLGNINTINAAIDNWFARTDKYTDKSLIDYINSKSIMTGHKAYTVKDFLKKYQKEDNNPGA